MAYWPTALGSIARNLISPAVGSNDRFQFAKEWLTYGLNFDGRPLAPEVDFQEMFPQATELSVDLEQVQYRRSNVNPFELYCLVTIARMKRPEHIFEIGTYDGATTLQLARACPESTIHTIDLAPDGTGDIGVCGVADEKQNVKEGGVGARFRALPEGGRITQLLGDSLKFDFSKFYGEMDFVFVDACHDYEFAAADTATALRLIRPNGTILWHDYQRGWPGVIKAVDEILPSHPIRHISGTTLAVLTPDD